MMKLMHAITRIRTATIEKVAMVRGSFRHLIVTDGGDVAGVLSVRDVVRCWTDDGASCDVDAA